MQMLSQVSGFSQKRPTYGGPGYRIEMGSTPFSIYSKRNDHPMGGHFFWSRIRESKATKHIDTQLLFAFVAEIVADYFLKYCKNQYQNGGMYGTSRHIFHSE